MGINIIKHKEKNMKILYVSTISDTINAFLIPHLKMLIESGCELEVACNINQPLNEEVHDLGIKVHDIPFRRSPLDRENILAYKLLKKLIIKEEYDTVHTHTPVASMIVRLVCRNKVKPQIIYTAHGFHFFKGAPLKNWLLYYPIERWLSKYTDLLITINKEDFSRASRFKSKKVKYIPGVGIDVDKINETSVDLEEKRKKLGVPKNGFILLSVGELNDNKNHQVVIKAIGRLNIPNIHYIICGQGINKNYLLELGEELGISNQIHLLGFREDVIEICKIADVFVFPSKREGLPVSIMEAMASGLPIIATEIRGTTDLVVRDQGGYLVKPTDVDAFMESIDTLYSDENIRKELSEKNREESEKYSINRILSELYGVYN